jgi:hypothetical protein
MGAQLAFRRYAECKHSRQRSRLSDIDPRNPTLARRCALGSASPIGRTVQRCWRGFAARSRRFKFVVLVVVGFVASREKVRRLRLDPPGARGESSQAGGNGHPGSRHLRRPGRLDPGAVSHPGSRRSYRHHRHDVRVKLSSMRGRSAAPGRGSYREAKLGEHGWARSLPYWRQAERALDPASSLGMHSNRYAVSQSIR